MFAYQNCSENLSYKYLKKKNSKDDQQNEKLNLWRYVNLTY